LVLVGRVRRAEEIGRAVGFGGASSSLVMERMVTFYLLAGGQASRSVPGSRLRTAGRRGRILAVAIGVVCSADIGPVAVSGTAHAQGECTAASTTTTCTHTETGEHSLLLPAGVSTVSFGPLRDHGPELFAVNRLRGGLTAVTDHEG
jgi:hypothetical protein